MRVLGWTGAHTNSITSIVRENFPEDHSDTWTTTRRVGLGGQGDYRQAMSSEMGEKYQ